MLNKKRINQRSNYYENIILKVFIKEIQFF